MPPGRVDDDIELRNIDSLRDQENSLEQPNRQLQLPGVPPRRQRFGANNIQDNSSSRLNPGQNPLDFDLDNDENRQSSRQRRERRR